MHTALRINRMLLWACWDAGLVVVVAVVPRRDVWVVAHGPARVRACMQKDTSISAQQASCWWGKCFVSCFSDGIVHDAPRNSTKDGLQKHRNSARKRVDMHAYRLRCMCVVYMYWAGMEARWVGADMDIAGICT